MRPLQRQLLRWLRPDGSGGVPALTLGRSGFVALVESVKLANQ